MKKFSRCALILILVAIISGVAGFFYFNQTTTPMYSSTTQLYVVPGAANEASIRAKDGGLNEDFMIIFKSNVVISAAQSKAGTSEDIAQYLTISSPENSNIIEITCMNPDQNTAKKYADAVAATAIKTTSIIPVESIQILSEGTTSSTSIKPDIIMNTAKVVGIASGVALFIEILIVLIIGAFHNKEEDYDDELEYERKYGKYATVNAVTKEEKFREHDILAELDSVEEAAVTNESMVSGKKPVVKNLADKKFLKEDSAHEVEDHHTDALKEEPIEELTGDGLSGDDLSGDNLVEELIGDDLAEDDFSEQASIEESVKDSIKHSTGDSIEEANKDSLDEEETEEVILKKEKTSERKKDKKTAKKSKSSAKIFGRIQK